MTRLVGMSIDDIKEAAKLVLAGGLVAYPTDTVYGLGCNPFDTDAVERLVKAKERIKGSLPILVGSLKDAERLGEMNEVAAVLANKFWPSPLTLVLGARRSFPLKVTGASGLVSLRISNQEKSARLNQGIRGAPVRKRGNSLGANSPKTAE